MEMSHRHDMVTSHHKYVFFLDNFSAQRNLNNLPADDTIIKKKIQFANVGNDRTQSRRRHPLSGNSKPLSSFEPKIVNRFRDGYGYCLHHHIGFRLQVN